MSNITFISPPIPNPATATYKFTELNGETESLEIGSIITNISATEAYGIEITSKVIFNGFATRRHILTDIDKSRHQWSLDGITWNEYTDIENTIPVFWNGGFELTVPKASEPYVFGTNSLSLKQFVNAPDYNYGVPIYIRVVLTDIFGREWILNSGFTYSIEYSNRAWFHTGVIAGEEANTSEVPVSSIPATNAYIELQFTQVDTTVSGATVAWINVGGEQINVNLSASLDLADELGAEEFFNSLDASTGYDITLIGDKVRFTRKVAGLNAIANFTYSANFASVIQSTQVDPKYNGTDTINYTVLSNGEYVKILFGLKNYFYLETSIVNPVIYYSLDQITWTVIASTPIDGKYRIQITNVNVSIFYKIQSSILNLQSILLEGIAEWNNLPLPIVQDFTSISFTLQMGESNFTIVQTFTDSQVQYEPGGDFLNTIETFTDISFT